LIFYQAWNTQAKNRLSAPLWARETVTPNSFRIFFEGYFPRIG